MLIEGPDYLSEDELEAEAYAAAVEGAIDVIGGFAFRAVGSFVRMRRVMKEGADQLATDVALLAVTTTANQTLASTMAAGFTEGVLEGMLGGAASSMVLTGLDAATWDQAARYQRNTLILAAKRGALIGAVVGGPAGVLGSLAARAATSLTSPNRSAIAGLTHRRLAKRNFFRPWSSTRALCSTIFSTRC